MKIIDLTEHIARKINDPIDRETYPAPRITVGSVEPSPGNTEGHIRIFVAEDGMRVTIRAKRYEIIVREML